MCSFIKTSAKFQRAQRSETWRIRETNRARARYTRVYSAKILSRRELEILGGKFSRDVSRREKLVLAAVSFDELSVQHDPHFLPVFDFFFLSLSLFLSFFVSFPIRLFSFHDNV